MKAARIERESKSISGIAGMLMKAAKSGETGENAEPTMVSPGTRGASFFEQLRGRLGLNELFHISQTHPVALFQQHGPELRRGGVVELPVHIQQLIGRRSSHFVC